MRDSWYRSGGLGSGPSPSHTRFKSRLGLRSLGARFRESTIRARTRIEVPEDRSRTWIATIFKPRRSLDHLRFKPKSGSSCLRVGPRSLEV